MAINLTGLDELEALSKTDGKPLELSIKDVIEDPEQPRKFFSEEQLNLLAISIKKRGVKSPISVKPKNADGKYIINHGARRFRASLLANQKTIRAFIDETHDDYDQAAENIQRENLTPMEIALFIHKRLSAGDKKGDIAVKLGQKPSYISTYLPLIEAPDFIQKRARTGKVGAKTLYLLTKAYKDYPVEIENYAANAEEITREGIAAIVERLQSPKVSSAHHVGENNAYDKNGHPVNITGENDISHNNSEMVSEIADEKSIKNTKTVQPNKLKNRILLIHSDRTARLIMSGKVQIRYIDNNEIAEIDLADVEIVERESI